LGYVYHLEGNSALAQSMWEKNLRDDPSNPMLHINLGLSMEKDGRYEEALDHYNKARALSPNDVSLLINIGNVYEAMNRFPEAAHAYTQALSSNKKDLAGYDLFLLSQKSGNAAVAKDMHQMLIKEFPASAYTKRAQADMHFKEGDTAKGISALESISDKDPVDWYTLARVYSDQADEKKTEQCLAMLPKEPIWDKAKTQIDAQKAFAAKDFNLAYSLLAGLHDTGFSVQYNCALAALQAKKYPEAVAIGETLVQKAKGKDRGDVCRVVGNAYFGLKQWKNAKQWYEQLAGMERNDAVVQYNCAVAAYNLDDVDGAWEYYQKARELNSSLSNKDIENKYASKHGSSRTDTAAVDSLDVLYNGAVTLQRDAKNDSAAELIYKKILDQKNDYYRAWNNLGAIFSERGELQEALRCFLRSIEKQHDIPEAYANLVNVYIAMDSLSSAQRWTTKGMGHNPDNDMLKELDARVKELMKTKKKKRRTAKETEG
jgi:tetratricopeptide (TPR) repeat protein